MKNPPITLYHKVRNPGSRMKILLAEHFGMYFGVRDALSQAEQLAAAFTNWNTIGGMTRIFQKVAEPLIIRFHPRYPLFSSSANVVG